ncbi:MAG: hypothetical protein JSU96_09155 [Acidobacteriota bacterium]|nr:MAG: hypothetical protein JSU96_09155 [Acidobacteriota bacterium]
MVYVVVREVITDLTLRQTVVGAFKERGMVDQAIVRDQERRQRVEKSPLGPWLVGWNYRVMEVHPE